MAVTYRYETILIGSGELSLLCLASEQRCPIVAHFEHRMQTSLLVLSHHILCLWQLNKATHIRVVALLGEAVTSVEERPLFVLELCCFLEHHLS